MTMETDGNFGATNECDLLTQDEAVGVLRLDQFGLRNPKETLRHLRRTGQLGYVHVAGKVLIPRNSILSYLRAHARPARDAVDADVTGGDNALHKERPAPPERR